jgi:hypothetical protein
VTLHLDLNQMKMGRSYLNSSRMHLFLPVLILNVVDLRIRQQSVEQVTYLSPGVMITMTAMSTLQQPLHKEPLELLLNVWCRRMVFHCVWSLTRSGHGRVCHMPWKDCGAKAFA